MCIFHGIYSIFYHWVLPARSTTLSVSVVDKWINYACWREISLDFLDPYWLYFRWWSTRTMAPNQPHRSHQYQFTDSQLAKNKSAYSNRIRIEKEASSVACQHVCWSWFTGFQSTIRLHWYSWWLSPVRRYTIICINDNPFTISGIWTTNVEVTELWLPFTRLLEIRIKTSKPPSCLTETKMKWIGGTL